MAHRVGSQGALCSEFSVPLYKSPTPGGLISPTEVYLQGIHVGQRRDKRKRTQSIRQLGCSCPPHEVATPSHREIIEYQMMYVCVKKRNILQQTQSLSKLRSNSRQTTVCRTLLQSTAYTSYIQI